MDTKVIRVNRRDANLLKVIAHKMDVPIEINRSIATALHFVLRNPSSIKHLLPEEPKQ